MSVDLRDFGLNPRLCSLVQDSLRPGEQVRWVGQPILHRRIDWGSYIGLLLFSCPFGGIGGAVLYFAFMGEIEAGGAGLFFAIRWEEGPNGGGGGRNVEYGFMNIRNVRLVEEILEKAIAERKNS